MYVCMRVCVSAMRHADSCLCCMLLAQASWQNPYPAWRNVLSSVLMSVVFAPLLTLVLLAVSYTQLAVSTVLLLHGACLHSA